MSESMNLTVTVDDDIMAAMDRYCESRKRETGDRPSRSAVVRLALFRFLELGGTKSEPQEDAQTAAEV